MNVASRVIGEPEGSEVGNSEIPSLVPVANFVHARDRGNGNRQAGTRRSSRTKVK